MNKRRIHYCEYIVRVCLHLQYDISQVRNVCMQGKKKPAGNIPDINTHKGRNLPNHTYVHGNLIYTIYMLPINKCQASRRSLLEFQLSSCPHSENLKDGNSKVTGQVLVNFSCEESQSKYFWLCRLCGLCPNTQFCRGRKHAMDTGYRGRIQLLWTLTF